MSSASTVTLRPAPRPKKVCLCLPNDLKNAHLNATKPPTCRPVPDLTHLHSLTFYQLQSQKKIAVAFSDTYVEHKSKGVGKELSVEEYLKNIRSLEIWQIKNGKWKMENGNELHTIKR